MDIVYMASSINQSNPLSAKFFIFFSEMLLALRLSNGSVLPPDSWSLPPTATASPSPSALACDSLPRSGCVSVSEPCSGTGPVKIVSSVGASDASAFLRSVLLGDYPVAIADSDNESCKDEDDNDNEDEKDEDEKNGKAKDSEDEDEDEDDYGVNIDRGKKNHVPRGLSDSSRRSTPEFSRSRNRNLSCSSNSSGIVGGTLIDALSAEGKEGVDDDIGGLDGVKKEDREEKEGEKEELKEQQNREEKDGDGDEEDANDDQKDEGDDVEDEEKEDEDDEGRDIKKEEEGEQEEVNDAASSAHSSFKRGNPMSDEKNSAMDEGDTAESNKEIKSEREIKSEMPSMKTISPHTSPRCLHSPPLKITESLRFLSVQKASSTVWGQHAGLYALMSLVHLYFTCCASEWNVKEGDMAIAMCQSVHAAVEKKARHTSTTDYNDVSWKKIASTFK